MAVALEGLTSGSANNGGSVTLTIPSSVREVGAVYLVFATVATSRAAFSTTVTTSSGGAYTKISSEITSSSIHGAVFRRICLSTAETTVTVTGTANASDSTSGVFYSFDGVSSATPEDATPTVATGGSTTPNSPSITPTGPYRGIISFVGLQLVATPTIPSSPTGITWQSSVAVSGNDNWDCTTATAWAMVPSSAAFDPGAWTSSATASWLAVTVALRPEIPAFSSPMLTIPSEADFPPEMISYGYDLNVASST